MIEKSELIRMAIYCIIVSFVLMVLPWIIGV